MYSAVCTLNRIQSDGVIEVHAIRGAIKAKCYLKAFPEKDIITFAFCRRDRHRLTQPDTRGSFWKLTFPEPIDGPLALGFGCHYGLGLFARRDED